MMVTAGFFSCGQTNKSTPETVDMETPASVKSIHNNKSIYTQYGYTDSNGKSVIIQNGYPRGGQNYTDPTGKRYSYAIFWTRIINETVNPLELKIDFPVRLYEIPDLPGNN